MLRKTSVKAEVFCYFIGNCIKCLINCAKRTLPPLTRSPFPFRDGWGYKQTKGAPERGAGAKRLRGSRPQAKKPSPVRHRSLPRPVDEAGRRSVGNRKKRLRDYASSPEKVARLQP